METSEVTKFQEAARKLNGELSATLANLSTSYGELKLPELITFDNGASLDSFPQKDVEKVIRKGVESGEMLFAINPDFNGQVFEVKKIQAGSSRGVVILALFPPDLVQRADIHGINLNDALTRCFAKVILEDMKIQKQKPPRGSIKTSLIGMVGIFNGKIISSQP